MISSEIVKEKMTTIKTAGDFKNSGIYPVSNIQPINLPQNHPKNTANKEAMKNSNNVVTSLMSVVKIVIISNAKIANRTPIGSTIIPSHFKIFADRGFKIGRAHV